MTGIKRYKVRKAHPNSKTCEITLPQEWLEFYDIKAGDELYVAIDEVLVISPNKEKIKEFLEKVRKVSVGT